MKQLHQNLQDSFPWYKKWHENRDYKALHYALLIVAVAITASIVFSSDAVKAAPTTYYVSTTGNDTSGTGSSTAPWRTVRKACDTVTNSGDKIYVNAGTYTEAQCSLAVGVSLEGAGIDQTIIKSTAVGDWNWYLSLESGTPTNGNQSISGITFNGQWTSGTNGTWIGIWVARRSNVTIHDTKVINFYDRGVVFDGHGQVNPLTDPNIYATGNKFYNNTVLNSARMMGGTGAGLLNIGGQEGMLIYNNTLIQDQRASGANGWPIKYWENGFLKGVKITNNVLKKKNFDGCGGQGQCDWDFAIELFNLRGLEIANNTIQGSIDLNYNYKGTYPYSVWIHDNIIDHTTPNQKMESGIIFEFATESALVERNILNNVSHAILYNARAPGNSGGYTYPAPTGGYSALTNNVIRNNLFSNVYSTYTYGNCCGGAGVQVWIEENTGNPYIRNMHIYNNTFVVRPNAAPPTGLDFSNANNGDIDGLFIKNNIFQGFTDVWFEGNAGPRFKNTAITNNNAWQNGNNNLLRWLGGNPTVNYVYNNNLAVTPGFISTTNFNLQTNPLSALIDKGIAIASSQLPSGVPVVPHNGSAPDMGYAETGSSAPDTTAPTVTSTNPVTGSTNVAVNIAPTVIFSEALNASTVTSASAFIKKADGTAVTATVVYSNNSVTLTPTSALAFGTNYVITMTTAIQDLIGNPLAANYTFNFTTGTAPNVPPTVNAGPDQTINLPANSVTMAGSASDPDGTIASRTWSKVSGPAATITDPTSYTTTITGLVYGTYVFRLTVVDNSNASAFDEVQVIVKDVVAPTISLTAPVGGATVSGNSVVVSANASDPTPGSGVDHVDFHIDGAYATTIGTDSTSPYSITWNSTTVPNGTHILTARAYDKATNFTTSSSVSITVTNGPGPGGETIPPTVSITAPTSGEIVTGNVIIRASAADNVAVAQVKFYRGTTPIGSDTCGSGPTCSLAGPYNYEVTWNTTGLSGSHSLTAVAYDTSGNMSTSSVVAVTIGTVNPPNGTYTAWNQNDKSSRVTLSNNNLTASRNRGIGVVRALNGKSAGKWYWEVTLNSAGDQFIGVAKQDTSLTRVLGSTANAWSMVLDDGVKFNRGNQGYYGTAGANGEVVGIALDMDNKKISFYKKRVGQTTCTNFGVAFSNLSGTLFPAWGSQYQNAQGTANFGSSPFACPVPAGFTAGFTR